MKTGHSVLSLAAAALLAAAAGTGCASARGPSAAPVTIQSETRDGRQAYALENEIYKAVLVPERAQFPLSLVNKATGHDYLALPESAAAANDWTRFFGIVDSLPWVSGKSAEGVKFPNKGCLHSVPWACATGGDGKTAWFEGTAEIAYQEPIGNATNRLRYTKRVTGRAGSPDILLKQTVLNTGAAPARFTLTLHARTGVAGYDKGDYLVVPGSRATVFYMTHPELAARGIVPGKETAWPIPEALEFAPSTNVRHVFVFTPASWGAAGDDKTGEALLFKGGRVAAPGGKRTFKMALFMTNHGYLLEPGLTSCIDATADTWSDPAHTIRLEPGQACESTLTLTPLSGVRRADWNKKR